MSIENFVMRFGGPATAGSTGIAAANFAIPPLANGKLPAYVYFFVGTFAAYIRPNRGGSEADNTLMRIGPGGFLLDVQGFTHIRNLRVGSNAGFTVTPLSNESSTFST